MVFLFIMLLFGTSLHQYGARTRLVERFSESASELLNKRKRILSLSKSLKDLLKRRLDIHEVTCMTFREGCVKEKTHKDKLSRSLNERNRTEWSSGTDSSSRSSLI